MAACTLVLLAVAICLPLAANAVGGTWSFDTPSNLGKASGLPTLQYTAILYNNSDILNRTACAMFSFDAILYDGVNLGAPHHGVIGLCSVQMTIRFGTFPSKESDASDTYGLTLYFAPTPIKGTNMSAITLRHNLTPAMTFTVEPETAMVAKRDKCYDCQADLVYHSTNASDPHTLTLHNVRLQAFLPHNQAAANQFSSKDATAVCPVAPETGWDAALYFGIAIGVLGAVGIVLFVRQSCKLRHMTAPAPGYQRIN